MSSDVAISVNNISKKYHIYESPRDRLKQMLWCGRRKFHDDFWALHDINFEVKKGETVGIIGLNGSGKSTLLQIICGTVAPTTGTVERNGRISALLELGSGFNPEFTGRENVFLNGEILGLTHTELEARFDEISAFADIGQFIDSPVKNYSSGMFARLAFSVAIHVDPEILIVDEILAVGDAAFQRKCLNKFYEIREAGCSILFVTHDAYQVKSACTRALYLKTGRQVAFGQSAEIVDYYMEELESTAKKSADAQPTAHADIGQVIRIIDVDLLDEQEKPTRLVQSGDTLSIRFSFKLIAPDLLEHASFVINLYRHDDFYICGTTTIMDGIEPYAIGETGTVTVVFPNISLLAGKYKWRVAINDDKGLGILTEAVPVCEFRVTDNFEAVGLVNLKRSWSVSSE